MRHRMQVHALTCPNQHILLSAPSYRPATNKQPAYHAPTPCRRWTSCRPRQHMSSSNVTAIRAPCGLACSLSLSPDPGATPARHLKRRVSDSCTPQTTSSAAACACMCPRVPRPKRKRKRNREKHAGTCNTAFLKPQSKEQERHTSCHISSFFSHARRVAHASASRTLSNLPANENECTRSRTNDQHPPTPIPIQMASTSPSPMLKLPSPQAPHSSLPPPALARLTSPLQKLTLPLAAASRPHHQCDSARGPGSCASSMLLDMYMLATPGPNGCPIALHAAAKGSAGLRTAVLLASRW
ncbi:hypothetical protein DE146DRAFT_654600 [Phaeosphaeria sp. MPI-PUGE-AT-0046c]|nr:hypothetical protein DE146DRAFT_654600 [Phaeosphaeria sp. MPI-PUGE-AT-0046c]